MELRAAVEELWAKEQELRDQAGHMQIALKAQYEAEAAQLVRQANTQIILSKQVSYQGKTYVSKEKGRSRISGEILAVLCLLMMIEALLPTVFV
jgi:cytochrome c biogenesis protein ResB